jgi:glycosyltransferase involved in cell wall biosynthesis
MNGLALVEAADHVCYRYRVRAFEPALEAAGVRLRVEPLDSRPLGRLAQLRRAALHDVVLLQRKLLPGWQWAILRRGAKRLVFDFDDAILYRDSYDRRGPHCPRRAARFGRTVREADLVLAGNAFLAEQATRHGASPERVRVIPTCVDTARLRPGPPRWGGPGPGLVWIGSSSTFRGLEQRRPLLERLGREIPGLRLRLIGDRFARFDPLDVEWVRWSEATEADALATADVGISLIPDDLWSRGKCGLKVLQYLACGLPVVANPVGVHPEMVRDGVEGFLPTTPEGWLRAIRALADDALRQKLGGAARDAAVARYSVRTWERAFTTAVLGERPDTSPLRSNGPSPVARPGLGRDPVALRAGD